MLLLPSLMLLLLAAPPPDTQGIAGVDGKAVRKDEGRTRFQDRSHLLGKDLPRLNVRKTKHENVGVSRRFANFGYLETVCSRRRR